MYLSRIVPDSYIELLFKSGAAADSAVVKLNLPVGVELKILMGHAIRNLREFTQVSLCDV